MICRIVTPACRYLSASPNLLCASHSVGDSHACAERNTPMMALASSSGLESAYKLLSGKNHLAFGAQSSSVAAGLRVQFGL